MSTVLLNTEGTDVSNDCFTRGVCIDSDGVVYAVSVNGESHLTLWRSVDRVTFTSAFTCDFVQRDRVTMNIGADDKIHLCYNSPVDGSVKYRKLSPSGSSYTSGAEETVVTPAGTFEAYGRRDLEVFDDGSVGILVMQVNLHTDFKPHALFYYKVSGVWTLKWFSVPDDGADGGWVDLCCTIARDATAPISGKQYLAFAWQARPQDPLHVRTARLEFATGTVDQVHEFGSIYPEPGLTQGINGLLFSYAPQLWTMVYSMGHGWGETKMKPQAFTMNRTQYFSVATTNAGPDSSTRYDPDSENYTQAQFGLDPDTSSISYALLGNKAVVLAGSLHSSNLADMTANGNGIVARVAEMSTEDASVPVFGQATQIAHGGWEFVRSGANRNRDNNIVDFVYVARDNHKVYYGRNNAPTMPSAVLANLGQSPVTTNQPVLTCQVVSDSSGLRRAVWIIASDEGLTTDVKTIPEPPVYSNALANMNDPTLTSVVSVGAQPYSKRSGLHGILVPFAQATSTGTRYLACKVVSEYGLESDLTDPETLTIIHPPSATGMTPTGGATVAYLTEGVYLQWYFSDGWKHDSIISAQAIVERSSDGAVLWNSGAVTLSPAQGPGQGHRLAAPASAFTSNKDVPLRWKITLTDHDGTVGPDSLWQSFKVSDPPEITITSPTEGSLVANPKPTITWDFVDTAFRSQKSYRVQVTNRNTSVVVYTATGGADHSHQVADAFALKTGQPYKVEVTVTDSVGLSATDTVDFVAQWIKPSAPAFNADPSGFEDDGFVDVYWDGSLAHDPQFRAWRVYRKTPTTNWELLEELTYMSPDGTFDFHDWMVPNNTVIQYKVVQVATRFGVDVESDNEPAVILTEGTHFWLLSPDDNFSMKLADVTDHGYTDEYESTMLDLIGRGRKQDIGTHYGKNGSLTVKLYDWGDPHLPTARAKKLMYEALKRRRETVWLRTPFGDIYVVALANTSVTQMAGTGTDEIVSMTIPYQEIL